jgi:hypothetical protein
MQPSDTAVFANVPKAEVICRVLREQRRVITRVLPSVAEGIRHKVSARRSGQGPGDRRDALQARRRGAARALTLGGAERGAAGPCDGGLRSVVLGPPDVDGRPDGPAPAGPHCRATARPASGRTQAPPDDAVGALGQYHDDGQLRCQDGRICPRCPRSSIRDLGGRSTA